MNRKQFLILLVLVLAVGGVGLKLYKGRAGAFSGGQSTGKKLLGEFQVNDVAHLGIKQGAAELNVVKKDGLWRVRERGDYPADFTKVSGLLVKFADLKVVQSEPIGTSQLARMELADRGSNAATVVDLRDASDKSLRTVRLGKRLMKKSGGGGGEEGWPAGRYVMAGPTDSVALVGDALEDAAPKAEDWLDKSFFKVEKPRTVAVTFPTGTNSWKLTRESEAGEWKLEGAKADEKLDPAKSSGVTYPLSAPSFVDVVLKAAPEQTGLDQPTTITIETFDDLKYTVKVGAKREDNYHFTLAVAATPATARAPGKDEKPEDKERLDKEFKERQAKLGEKLKAEQAFTQWTYLVSGWSVDALLKDRASLLEEKKPDEPKAEEKAEPKDAK